MNSIKHFLHQALTLANERRGFCAPNPSVGAVVVKDGIVVGTGHHVKAGLPHAEVNALNQASQKSIGATLFVTLEPCSHTGRTPPCVDAIINANITKVYFGFYDPNPLVAGKGKKRLEQAGIACEYFPTEEITEFYRSYNHWVKHKKPWVTVKIAVSSDGKVALQNGAPAKITGIEANQFTHQKRLHTDAILTTANTIINDDPQLTARPNGNTIAKPIYVLDRNYRLPASATIHTSAKRLTVFHAHECKPSPTLECCIPINTIKSGLDLSQAISFIGKAGIHDLWVEVGSQAFDSFITQGIADEVLIYQAKLTLGENALPLKTSIKDILTLYKQLPSFTLGTDKVQHFIKQAV